MDLAGKVALVTGGAQGIGREYTKALIENGSKVVVCDIKVQAGKDLERSLNKCEKQCVFFHCDVTDASQFEECFKSAISEFGRLDIVVNNAGILDDSKSSWEKEIDVNLCGVIRGSLLGLEYLKKGGCIVVTTSFAGIYKDSLYPIYAASKGGANYFVRSLGSAICYEHTGVRILAIAPSLTDTPIVSQLSKETTLFPEMHELSKDRTNKLYLQKPVTVAACLIDILKANAPSGSIWLVDKDTWREVNYDKLLT